MVHQAGNNMRSLHRKVIVLVAIIFLVPIVATYCGHGKLAWIIFGELLLTLWCFSPRRRYPTAEHIAEGVDLSGQVVFITGPTSGIGEETARVMAKRGAHVILVARSVKKLEASKAAIEKSLSGSDGLLKPQLTCLQCDLDDLQSVRACAEEFKELDLAIDILICNAGIMADPVRRKTKQGFEQQMGVNHIAHFILVNALLPFLRRARKAKGAARVVVLSSSAHRAHDPDYLLGLEKAASGTAEYFPEDDYEGWTAYGNAKMSNLLFAKEFHRQYKEEGISAFSVNPGGIHTGLQGNVDCSIKTAWLIATPFVFKSIPQGAATTVLCALKAGKEDGGKYFDNCAPTDFAEKFESSLSEKVTASKGKSTSAQEILWEQSVRIGEVLLGHSACG